MPHRKKPKTNKRSEGREGEGERKKPKGSFYLGDRMEDADTHVGNTTAQNKGM